MNTRDVFVRTLFALEPYLGDIVLVGGWVHELYLREGGFQQQPVRTDDIDFTLPETLDPAGRPFLLELTKRAGFEPDICGEGGEALRLVQPVGETLLDLDLITEGARPHSAAVIAGQDGLIVQAYPGQKILLENARWIWVGEDVHASLKVPVKVRVPTVPAYVLHKGLSATQRTRVDKQAKDYVYEYEILAHPTLGPTAIAGLADLASRYPDDYRRWRASLEFASAAGGTRRLIAEHLVESNIASIGSPQEVEAKIAARFSRALRDSPP